MDWAKGINNFFKVKGAYEDVGNVKQISDYASKIKKKKKLTWDDLDFFGDATMKKLKANAKASITKAEQMLKLKVVLPKRNTEKEFEKMYKAAAKFGTKSRQAEAAILAYCAALGKYHNAIIPAIAPMEDAKAKFNPKIKAAESLEKYARVLHKAFEACTKIPSPTGTGQNSQFFSLSQDALHLAGQYQTLASLLKKIKKKNADAYDEGNQMANDNGLWTAWALELGKKDPDTIAKNRRAKKPKK